MKTYQVHPRHLQEHSPSEDRCLLEPWAAWVLRVRFVSWKDQVTEFLNRKVTVATVELNQASHLSRLLFLGICFPARAHNSPSDGCLNLKRLRKPTGWGIRQNWIFSWKRSAFITCRYTRASARRRDVGPFFALCWPPASSPPTEPPSEPSKRQTYREWILVQKIMLTRTFTVHKNKLKLHLQYWFSSHF